MIFRTKTLISMFRLEDTGSKMSGMLGNPWKSMISGRFAWIGIHANRPEIIDFQGFPSISDNSEPVSSSLSIEINVFVLKIIQNQGFQENSEGVSSHGMGVCQGCRSRATSVCWKRLASPYNFIELPQYGRRCWRSSTVDHRAVSVWSTLLAYIPTNSLTSIPTIVLTKIPDIKKFVILDNIMWKNNKFRINLWFLYSNPKTHTR